MVQIYTVRVGLRVLAVNVNDYGIMTRAWGLTPGGAEQRLLKKLESQLAGEG